MNKSTDEFFNRGHFQVKIKNEEPDDYDNVIPEYIAKLKKYGNIINSNGSEVYQVNEIQDVGNQVISLFKVAFIFYDVEFEDYTWEPEQEVICKGIIENDIFVVNEVEFNDE